MEKSQIPSVHSDAPELARTPISARFNFGGFGSSDFHGSAFPGLKKRGQAQAHGSRSWIKIDQCGNSKNLELDKSTVMRHCSLPARDLRLLDPLFIYPSTLLGREKAIVVSLEQIRCIITADEVILLNCLDAAAVHYTTELCKRLQNRDQSGYQTLTPHKVLGKRFLKQYHSEDLLDRDDLPFEFKALELALELTCMSLDTQVKDLEMEIHPVLDELASSISTLNLERVRKLKGHLLALTQRVQKVCDEIEHLMNDDGDMAEMYLTEKKQRTEAHSSTDLDDQANSLGRAGRVSRSAPVSPVGSINGVHELQRAFSCIDSIRHGSLTSSSPAEENIDQLEMLLEAYFVIIDNTLNMLLSLKEHIDDTEDLINIKLANVQNQLIQFELLLTAATFVATIFAVVTAVFGMNFQTTVFDDPATFNWVLIVSGVFCGMMYIAFLIYFRHKKVFPLYAK